MYLFNEVPVTEDDIDLWLDNIANLSQAKFRREAYRKAYRVEDKIRAAKRAGQWPPNSEKKWLSTKENIS
ncbi:hypothetical protein GALL_71020 [mine drainage metagenome]|uniref:Uncharacterized protein n=1 Tax=mine drainage metagenome TaxID=410659 RepID=A0A1J5TFZ1_9ZZZZ